MGQTTGTGGQRYLLGIWIAVGVFTPLMGFLGARGFAPVVGLLGFLCLPQVRPRREDWIAWGLLAALVVWAVVSASWSPATQLHTTKDFSRFTGFHLAMQLVFSSAFVMAAARLDEEGAEKSLNSLTYGMWVLASLVVIEGLTQAAIYQRVQGIFTPTVRPDIAVRNVAIGGYVLAALIWPVAVTLWRQGRRLLVGLLALAVAFCTVFLRGDSPTIALIVSAVVFLAVLKGGRPMVWATGAIAAGYWLLTPWIMLGMEKVGLWGLLYGHLPASWDRRMEIWSFANQRIREAPLQGWGLDASRTFKGYIQLHPHDGSVQTWLELGVPGPALIAAFFAFLFWRIGKAADERLFAATACATATVYLVIGAISFSLWQEWWICLGALAMAACVALRRYVDKPVHHWTYQSGEPLEAA